MKNKRYVLKVDLYVYADNDQDAIQQSNNIINNLKKLDDNKASILRLDEQPFGTLGSRNLIKK